MSVTVLKLDISSYQDLLLSPFSDLLKRLYLISFPDFPFSLFRFYSSLLVVFLKLIESFSFLSDPGIPVSNSACLYVSDVFET